MKIFKIFIALLFAFIISCNNIEDPLKPIDNTTCGDENGTLPIRKILVEDYTAHKCVFCPLAANTLEEIKDKYCDHIIPIGIHVGYLAEPDDEFQNDFRTNTGNELDNYYNISASLPKGLINRTKYDGNILLSSNNWASFVNTLYSVKPEIDITVESMYDEETKKVTTTISAEYLANINSNMNVGLYVTEDSIISPQKLVGSPTIEDYVHRHMLRKSITSAFGDNFVSSANFGDIIEKEYTFSVENEWNINHLELVAFISNTETKEIIQAESEPLEK